jgi:hypothetical protein
MSFLKVRDISKKSKYANGLTNYIYLFRIPNPEGEMIKVQETPLIRL